MQWMKHPLLLNFRIWKVTWLLWITLSIVSLLVLLITAFPCMAYVQRAFLPLHEGTVSVYHMPSNPRHGTSIKLRLPAPTPAHAFSPMWLAIRKCLILGSINTAPAGIVFTTSAWGIWQPWPLLAGVFFTPSSVCKLCFLWLLSTSTSQQCNQG